MRMISRRAMLSGTGALALLPAAGWSQDQTLRESPDPRIRDFNNTLRLLRRLFPLRVCWVCWSPRRWLVGDVAGVESLRSVAVDAL